MRIHPMHLIKLVVLGSPGCGKTSLVRQFVQHDFDDAYHPSMQKQHYYPTVLMDERLYELQIVDLPPVQSMPKNSLDEWNHYRGYGIRHAHAYLLVFDVTSAHSFQCVKNLRDQICALHTDPIIVVAGTKQDLLLSQSDPSDACVLNNNLQNTNTGRNSATNGSALLNNYHQFYQAHMQQQQHHQHHTSQNAQGGHGSVAMVENRLSTCELNKELANMARKQWKCAYVECSAKYNWRVMSVFSALMKAVDRSDDLHFKKQVANEQTRRRRINAKCRIL